VEIWANENPRQITDFSPLDFEISGKNDNFQLFRNTPFLFPPAPALAEAGRRGRPPPGRIRNAPG